MVDAVISVAVERAAAILEEHIRYELNLVRGVEKEVLNLSKELGTIRTVLDDADKRGTKEQSVQRWLKKLESTAYQMEDILDERHYALLKHKIANQKSARSEPFSSYIEDYLDSFCSRTFHEEGSEWRSISHYNPHLKLRLNDVDAADD